MGLAKKLGLLKGKKVLSTKTSSEGGAGAGAGGASTCKERRKKLQEGGRDAMEVEQETKVAEYFLDSVEEEDEDVVPDVVQDAQNHDGKDSGEVASCYGSSQEPPWQLKGHWLERAKRELNEDPERTLGELDRLRSLVLSDTKLKSRTDNTFLIRFLRARKFNVAAAFRLVQRYYQMKRKHPNLFRVDDTSRLKTMMTYELHGILAGRDNNGSRILLIKIDKYDGSVLTVDDYFRLSVAALEQIVREPETQVSGVTVIVDLAEFGLQHTAFVSPYYTRNTIEVVQESFPLRFKGFHVLHQPFYFWAMYACSKPFIKEKIRRRIFVHGRNYAGLAESIPVHLLPVNYGGPPGGFGFKRWHQSILALQDYFTGLETYGYPEEEDSSGADRRGRRQSRSGGSAPSSRRQSQA